ncbi:DUF2948 family protein [Microbulbifer sp. S227A]|uniref:DUF2948 family protein n=1 Tax=Microbulbifer sp. S227A TaxID=3415131 RepID=UPI003C7D13A9
MSQDATFEDGRERPLNLGAQDTDDLRVISSLAQDAVFPITEMRWQARQHRFAMLLNRFRWEDDARDRHAPERVQSLLVVDNVVAVSSQGIDRGDQDLILSLLAIEFSPADDGAGDLVLTLAGDGALRLRIEALDVTLKDVTRPYVAPSGKAPDHRE